MLRSAARQAAPLRHRQLRVGTTEVGECDPAAARQPGVREVTQSPTEPERQRERQTADRRGEAAGGYADRRRRSLYSSTAIGISESTITITTTTWMCSLMFGIVCPRR